MVVLDPVWTPDGPETDLFHDLEERSIFVCLCFIGIWFGGPGEIRTHDLFHAMEARSQLRHRPTVGVLS